MHSMHLFRVMAYGSIAEYGILLKYINLAEHKDGSSRFKIDKGELLVEIHKKDRIPRQGHEPAHNYSLYGEPTVTLYDDGTRVCPLEEAEFQCLAAVPDRTLRLVQYTTGKLEWVTNLRVGDMVFFHLGMDPKAHPIIKGKIRYFGKIEGHEGFMFGNEICDLNFRGRGTTNGSPYFNCGHKNAVYVAMDKITKKVNSDSSLPNNTGKDSSRDYSIDEVIVIERKPQIPVEGSAGNPLNHRKGTSGDRQPLLDKAKDLRHKIVGLANVTPTPISSDVPSRFLSGDRVVLQSAKGGIVKGVVRWAGPLRISGEAGGIIIPVVGIETNRPVNHEEEFPGLVTGIHGQHLFTVARNHGRIYVAEQVVLTEDEYQDIKRKEKRKSEEGKEAKKWGMSVKEYIQQRELLSERNAEKDRVQNLRKQDPTPPLINEHNSYRPQYSDDMNDALNPIHPRHDDHHSPLLQFHYNNPPQYQPHPPPQYSVSSTGHTPPMGDTGGRPRHPSIPSDPSDFTVGTMVNVQLPYGPPRYGVIQWIGTLPNFDRLFAGVELDEYLDECSDGTYNGRRYFTCPYGRGLFCLMSALLLDERYMESHQLPPANRSQHNSKTVLGLASPTVDESDRLKQEVRQLKEALERKEEEFVVTIEKLRNAHQEEEKRYQTTKRELDQHRREMERILEAHKSDEFKQSWQISNKNIQITAQELGKGGWGAVVVGVFREQKVAVKQLYNIIKSEHYLAIMNREINTMSRLRHPNLLLFIGAVLDHPSGNPLIITEIMDISLRQAYEKGQLTNDDTSKLSVLRDTASGLNYLHCHHDEIIHRDVSSANVLLESRGTKKWRAKLSDFGSANIARQAYTQQMGAAVYSAPEAFVALGDQEQQQTTKMDVYSYGILSCEVMCCQFPGSHAVFRTMLSRVHTSSPSIGQMIQDCMNKSFQQRPTMAHVIHCLDDMLQ